MTKQIILFFFIFLASLSVRGMDHNEIDSLKNNVDLLVTDSLVFDRYYSIALKYIKIAPDSSLKYINLGIKSIDKNKYPNRYFDAINLKGACYWFDNQLDSAKNTYYNGLNYSIDIQDTNMLAKISNNIGITFQFQGEIDSAEKYLYQACKLYRAIDNKKALAKASLDLGGLYTSESRYDLAVEELLNGLSIFEEIDDTLYLIHGYNSVGNLYLNINEAELALKYYQKSLGLVNNFDKGDISDELYCNIGLVFFQEESTYDSAEYYFKKALSKEGIEHNLLLYSTALVNLATLKNNQHKYSEAIHYFNIIKDLDDTEVEPYSKMACLINLGSTYLEIGQIKKARLNLNEGLRYSKSLNSLEFQKNAYQYLSRCDSIEGNYFSAYKNYQKYHEIEAEIYNSKAEEQLQILISKNKLHKIQTENEYLENQNKLKQDLLSKHIALTRFATVALILTFLILIITYFLYKKSKSLNLDLHSKNRKINTQKEELQTLNTQLNKLISIIAHDLKAPFNSLLGLLSELDSNSQQYTEDEKNAIIKALLENTKSTYKLLENLMQWSISQSGLLTMKIEKVKLSNILDEALTLNRIQIENKLLVVKNELNPHAEVYADKKMTFSIFTNLINNAIKYNHPGGLIGIKTETLKDSIKVVITDVGVGIPKEYIDSIFSIESEYQMRGTENEYGTGLGLKVVAEFIRRMNGKVSASNNEKGTSFIFELPSSPPS